MTSETDTLRIRDKGRHFERTNKICKLKLRVSVFFSWYPRKNNNSTNIFRQIRSNVMDTSVQSQAR